MELNLYVSSEKEIYVGCPDWQAGRETIKTWRINAFNTHKMDWHWQRWYSPHYSLRYKIGVKDLRYERRLVFRVIRKEW